MGEGGGGLPPGTDALIEAALAEDGARADRTTLWTVPEDATTGAGVVARQDLVVAGGDVAAAVFRTLDPALEVRVLHPEGTRVAAGTRILAVRGRTRSILAAERTALNFLGRLSGIATLTHRFVEAVDGTGARITDTRKTTPGWRRLEKAAVRAGGGVNHRMGLHDMVLVKENHVTAAGGVRAAVDAVRERNTDGLPVEVEVEALDQLEELRGARIDRILLDNMPVEEMTRAVQAVAEWPRPRPELEASGRMDLARVGRVAGTGVHWISVGALTHSAPVADCTLLVDR